MSLNAREWIDDTREMLIFFSRLPVPRAAASPPSDFSLALRAAPVAGAVIGTGSAVVLAACVMIGLPPLVSAAICIAATVAATGALHEDALADVADGFGGGDSRERKLEIMRDSAIGSYGVAALCLALLIRTSAVAALVSSPHGPWTAVYAIIAAAALSRGGGVSVLGLLDPARSDGLGHMAGRLSQDTLMQLLVASGLLGGITLILGVGLWAAAVAIAGAAAATWAMISLARNQIGGHTGDVAGATQQAVDCTVLIAILAAISL